MMDTNGQTIDAAATAAEPEEENLLSKAEGVPMSDIIAALRTVHDPEIPLNIFDLGLVYRIDVLTGGRVEIDMTLTAPGCPVAGEMMGWVKTAVTGLEGVTEAKVNLVFDPPWDQSLMSEEAKLELGLS